MMHGQTNIKSKIGVFYLSYLPQHLEFCIAITFLTLNIPRGVLWSPQRTPLGMLLANFC